MAEVNQIKASFQNQVRAEFENPKISPFTQNWQPGIDLLFEVIKFPIDGINLYNDLLNALEDVLINKPTDYNALVSFVNYLEKYLALIGNFTNQTAAISKPFTLMPLIKAVLSDKLPWFDCSDRTNIDTHRQQPKFVAHIYRAYCTRNDVNHSGDEDGGLPNWAENQSIILQNRDSVLVVLLYATLLHYQALKKAIEEKQHRDLPDIVPYLNRLISRFNQWEQRKIMLYAREEVDLDEERRLREGYVEQFWQDIPERQLMLLGEAGMGKSTTLQCLALEEAKNCLKAPGQENIPIYIELKLLIDSTLWQEIKQNLPFSDDITESLFMQGKINLFLDGLNEVSKYRDRRKAVIDEIQNLITRYPDVRLMVAGREGRVFRTSADKKVPMFALRKMGNEQIKEFLAKNTRSDETRKLLQPEVDNNSVIAWAMGQ